MAASRRINAPVTTSSQMVDPSRVAALVRQKPRIILGSSSSARKQLFTELAEHYGFIYEVKVAGIDEKAIRDPHPETLVRMLAHAKREAIIAKLKREGEKMSGLLITCDQVVVHEDRILEKPNSFDEAHEFIDGYGRSPASTVGAVVATHLETGRIAEGVQRSHIHFRPIPAEVREKLVEEGEVFYCAGGLMVEHPLVEPHIERMEGTQCSVMGLPKQLTLELMLQAAGL